MKEASQSMIFANTKEIGNHIIKERKEEPKKMSKNRITWSSITRSHEIAFYNENLMPVEVVLVE